MLLLIHCLLFLPLYVFLLGPCFVVCFMVSFLISNHFAEEEMPRLI